MDLGLRGSHIDCGLVRHPPCASSRPPGGDDPQNSLDELAARRDAMLCALLDVCAGHAVSGSRGAAASQPA